MSFKIENLKVNTEAKNNLKFIFSKIVLVDHDLVFELIANKFVDNRQMMNSENRSILCLNLECILIVPCRWRSIIFVEHDVRIIIDRVIFHKLTKVIHTLEPTCCC